MILIARHGAGRGRDGAYLQSFLDELARSKPRIFEALRFWETGTPEPSFEDVRAVVFWLADPLRERYPDCFAEALDVDREASSRGLQRVNPPECLSNTRKSVQGEIWTRAGIPTPPQSPYTTRAELLAAARVFPVILRSETHHSQRRMKVIRSRAQLERRPDKVLPYPGALAPFLDLRRGHARGSVWSRFHHRKRAVVMGDQVLPIELFFSRKPIVSSKSATFSRYREGLAARFPAATQRLLGERGCVTADLAYFREGDAHAALLVAATRVLGLHWCAIDYSVDGAGHPMLWEANPYFDFPPAETWYLPEMRRSAARQSRLTDCIAAWLEEILDKSPAAR